MMRRNWPAARHSCAALVALVAIVVTACATTPVGVTRMDPRGVHEYLTGGALSTGAPSVATRNVLVEQDLVAAFDDTPATALATLHAVAISPVGRQKHLYALAELSFLHAERSHERAYYLAAAVYAWAYLFPRDPARAPDPFDPRFRGAADLYNRSLTSGFAAEGEMRVALAPGIYRLSFGELEVALDERSLHWDDRRLGMFVPMADLEVRGLETRYRTPGIGAPLAAEAADGGPGAPDGDFVSRYTKVPVTAVLHLADAEAGLASGRLRGTLRVYAADSDKRIQIGDHLVPIETERTAVIAYGLAEAPIWEQELSRFFRSVGVVGPESARLVAAEPYTPGRIPVVLVHGTVSSAGRWAELFNRLWNDPQLQERYQFWFFQYDSGTPITYSALLLRQALEQTATRLDPAGRDAALREMVVLGHSQGGLLAKLLTVQSGSRLYEANFTKPLADLNVSEETREIIRKSLFVEPSPYVRRVIFMATPHRGSYLVRYHPARWLARLITLPFNVLRAGTEVLARERDSLRTDRHLGSTSLDNMHPNDPNIQTLAGLASAPGVYAHSIIGVHGNGPVEDDDDGVVEYRSAHLEGVDSELVVRSGHSVQWNSAAIEEVRRILLLHAAGDRP